MIAILISFFERIRKMIKKNKMVVVSANRMREKRKL